MSWRSRKERLEIAGDGEVLEGPGTGDEAGLLESRPDREHGVVRQDLEELSRRIRTCRLVERGAEILADELVDEPDAGDPAGVLPGPTDDTRPDDRSERREQHDEDEHGEAAAEQQELDE
jgi:hypothetical protein